MPTIIITTLSPGQLFRQALTAARVASAEIQRLKDAPLAPGESLADRTLLVATHAHALSEAFEIIDALAGSCEPADMRATTNVSPPSSTESPAPGHRGVHQESEDPNTN